MSTKDENIVNEVEIRKGLTIEEMQAMYFNKKALVEQPERVFRLHKGNDRIYYTVDGRGEPSFYLSLTTLISRTMPTSPHLIKWIADKGYEESKEYAKERADYGSFMHAEFARLLIDRKLDLDTVDERFRDFIEVNQLPIGTLVHADEIKKDILAFAQWISDYNVEPLAIEIILTHSEGFGAMLDLVCMADIPVKGKWGEVYKSGAKKGQPKETTEIKRLRCCVDFKSGRKGFYESNSIQLRGQKELWEQAYPDKPIDRLFNWSPKDWRSEPSYNFRDWTGHKNQEKFWHLVEIAKIELMTMDSSFKNYHGKIDLDKGFNYNENVETLTLSDAVREKQEKEDSK